MENIREFIHKLKEVSHIKIGIQLLKILNLEVQFWVPILKAIGLVKSNMIFEDRISINYKEREPLV